MAESYAAPPVAPPPYKLVVQIATAFGSEWRDVPVEDIEVIPIDARYVRLVARIGGTG